MRVFIISAFFTKRCASTERETRYYIDKDYYVLLQDNAEFLAIGVRLKELFDGEFKNAFSIHEDAEL